ncbi:MAG: OmpH family outer membrane protein [Saprospiraceae bacterium]|nr:OmpH family outer membrane protein [Saprospiraceae bacterium]
MLRVILAFVLVTIVSVDLHSQKFGHVNYRMLIDSLNDGKSINDQLNRYEKSLTDVGQKMITQFQNNFKKYQDSVSKGSLSQEERQKMESDLEVEQNSISNYQKSANESLEKRNAELLKPFLDKLSGKIKEFADKEGYTLIFDSSMGLINYPPTSDLLKQLVDFVDKK